MAVASCMLTGNGRLKQPAILDGRVDTRALHHSNGLVSPSSVRYDPSVHTQDIIQAERLHLRHVQNTSTLSDGTKRDSFLQRPHRESRLPFQSWTVDFTPHRRPGGGHPCRKNPDSGLRVAVHAAHRPTHPRAARVLRAPP